MGSKIVVALAGYPTREDYHIQQPQRCETACRQLPGVTVERRKATADTTAMSIMFVDLPGTYSLYRVFG
jgi:hypothetical protein